MIKIIYFGSTNHSANKDIIIIEVMMKSDFSKVFGFFLKAFPSGYVNFYENSFGARSIYFLVLISFPSTSVSSNNCLHHEKKIHRYKPKSEAKSSSSTKKVNNVKVAAFFFSSGKLLHGHRF